MKDVVLQTRDLTKSFGRREVVDCVSLEVCRGDIFGFLGQNGAGKSTTLRMVLGLVRPTSGTISLLGFDIRKDLTRALRRTGAMLEAPAFYETLSGRQNLRLFAAMSGGASERRIDEVLDVVGLTGRAREPVRTYSHGMRQRLGIAQSLLPGPDFVILDEPTDGLDPQGIHEMRGLISSLGNLGLTVMLSSHLLHEVEQLCNRVAIIDHGRLLWQGGLSDLIGKELVVKLAVNLPEKAIAILSGDPEVSVSRDADRFLYLRVDPKRVAHINRMLVDRGLEVMEISPQTETLEQVFLRLTRPRSGTDRYIA